MNFMANFMAMLDRKAYAFLEMEQKQRTSRPRPVPACHRESRSRPPQTARAKGFDARGRSPYTTDTTSITRLSAA